MVYSPPYDLGNPLLAELDAAGLAPPSRMPRAEKFRATVYRIADPEDAQGVLDDIEGLFDDPDEATIADLAAKRRAKRVGALMPTEKPQARIKLPFGSGLKIDPAEEAVSNARKALLQQEDPLTKLREWGNQPKQVAQRESGLEADRQSFVESQKEQMLALEDPANKNAMLKAEIEEQARKKGEAFGIGPGPLAPVGNAIKDAGLGLLKKGMELPAIYTTDTVAGGGGATRRGTVGEALTPNPTAEAFQEQIERYLNKVPVAGKALGLASELIVPTSPLELALAPTGVGLAGDVTDIAKLGRLGVKGAKAGGEALVRKAVTPEPSVLRVAVKPGGIAMRADDSLAAARGSAEIADPSKVRLLAEGEALQPGEELYFHGTAGEIRGGRLEAGAELTPKIEDAESYARSTSVLTKREAGPVRQLLSEPERGGMKPQGGKPDDAAKAASKAARDLKATAPIGTAPDELARVSRLNGFELIKEALDNGIEGIPSQYHARGLPNRVPTALPGHVRDELREKLIEAKGLAPTSPVTDAFLKVKPTPSAMGKDTRWLIDDTKGYSDGYFAEFGEIPTALKGAANSYTKEVSGSIAKLAEGLDGHTRPVELHAVQPRKGQPLNGMVLGETAEGQLVALDNKYVRWFTSRHPNVEFLIDARPTTKDTYSNIIRVTSNGEDIGLIMPIFVDAAKTREKLIKLGVGTVADVEAPVAAPVAPRPAVQTPPPPTPSSKMTPESVSAIRRRTKGGSEIPVTQDPMGKAGSDSDVIGSRAVRELGTTDNPVGASFMLPDGRMIKNPASPLPDVRAFHHRNAAQAIGATVEDVMNTGAVRLAIAEDSASIAISGPLTPQQMRGLTRALRGKETVYLDAVDMAGSGSIGAGRTLVSETLEMPTAGKLQAALDRIARGAKQASPSAGTPARAPTLTEQLEATLANAPLVRQRADDIRGAPQPVRTPDTPGNRPPADAAPTERTPTVYSPEKIDGLLSDIREAIARGPDPLPPEAMLQNVQEGGVVARAAETPQSTLSRYKADPDSVQKGTIVGALKKLGVDVPSRNMRKDELAKVLSRRLGEKARATQRVREAEEVVEAAIAHTPDFDRVAWQRARREEVAARIAAEQPTTAPTPVMQGATAPQLDLNPAARSDEARQRLAAGGGSKRPPSKLTLAGSEYDERGFGRQVIDEILGTVGAPISLKSVLSPPFLRQGLPRLVLSPKKAFSELGQSLKVAMNEVGARKMMDAIKEDPWVRKSTANRTQQNLTRANYEGLTWEDVGGSILDWGDDALEDLRPEELQALSRSRVGRAVQNSPIGKVSNRQAAVELNLHRTNWYREVAKRMYQAGERDPKMYEGLRKTIEHMTQRGSLGQGSMPFFFSLRAQSGRWQSLIDPFIQPGSLLKPSARQEAAKGMLGMVGANMAMIAGAAYVADELGIDDVAMEMKNKLPVLRWGRQHFDPWAGWNTPAKLIAGLGTDIAERLGDGDLADAPQDIMESLWERGTDYARSGLSPLVGAGVSAGTGKDYLGRDYNISKEITSGRIVKDMIAPFLIEDLVDAYLQEGLVAATVRAPYSFLSGGGQTYADPKNEQARALYRKEYSELSPEELKAVDSTPEVMKYKAENPTDYQQRKGEVMGPIDQEQAVKESAFLEGKLARPLPDEWHDLGIKRMQASNDLTSQFEEQFQGFDKDRFDKARDEYYATQVIDKDNGSIDWEATEAARELYMDTLPADEKQWIDEALKVAFGNQSELRQEYLTYIDKKEASGYFREGITTAEREALDAANPELDVQGWYWRGGVKDGKPPALQTADAVNQALAMGLPNRPIKMAGFDRQINENEGTVAAWQQFGTRASNYLNDVQVNRDKERIAVALYGRDYQRLKKWDGTSALFDTLSDSEKQAVATHIREGVRRASPDLDAYLAWMGKYDTIYRDTDAIATLRILRQTFGREPERESGPIRYKD